MAAKLFSALLKFWRRRRGLSQLDLALAADVSARHVSFLESGRSEPSEEMVLRLLATLDVPLRDQNEVLRAASFAPRFPEPDMTDIDPSIELAITRMMQQQEPLPLTVMTTDYDIVRGNRAAVSVFKHFTSDTGLSTARVNLFDHVFDPRLGRSFIKNWDTLGRRMVARLHRDALLRGSDARLWTLLERVLAYPNVPQAWRQPEFANMCEATCPLILERGALTMQFLTTITAFSAPQNVTVEEMRIESYFALDEATRIACEAFACGDNG